MSGPQVPTFQTAEGVPTKLWLKTDSIIQQWKLDMQRLKKLSVTRPELFRMKKK